MLKLTARKPERTLKVLPKDCHETPEGPRPPRTPKEELPEYLLPRKVPVSQLELPPGRQDDFRLLPPRHRGRPQNTHLGLGMGPKYTFGAGAGALSLSLSLSLWKDAPDQLSRRLCMGVGKRPTSTSMVDQAAAHRHSPCHGNGRLPPSGRYPHARVPTGGSSADAVCAG